MRDNQKTMILHSAGKLKKGKKITKLSTKFLVNSRVLATRTEGCEFESQPSHTIDLNNVNRYTQLSTKLGSDIDQPERWLSSGQMLCERFPCQNGKLNALGPPTQDPH